MRQALKASPAVTLIFACAAWLVHAGVGGGPRMAHAVSLLEDATGSDHGRSSHILSASGLVSKRSLAIALAGGTATWLAYHTEDAAAEARFLGRGPFEEGSDVGNAYGDGRVLAAGALGLWVGGRFGQNQELTATALEIVKTLAVSGAAVWTLKIAVHRSRPDGGRHSFPSGHTASAFSVAPVLAHRFGWRVAVPAYALATITAAGRMEDRRHYLSDVVFGATIGLISGEAVVRGGREARLLDHFRLDENGVRLTLTF